MRVILSMLAVIALAAAAGCRSDEQARAIDPAVDALGVAISPCGRYRLRLDHAEWKTEPSAGPRLSLQTTCETGEADAFVCGSARVTDFVSEAGVQWRGADLDGRASVDGRSGSVVVRNLKQYERASTARRVRVECHVMRVFEWRTFAINCPSATFEEELVCPPYHVGVFGDADGCRVSAYCTEDLDSFPPAQRDLFGLLGHDWVAYGAELMDADGRPLFLGGAAGTGGATVAMYRFPLPGDSKPVRFPLTGTLRLPKRYVVEVVPFEFKDLGLIRE